MLRDLVAPYRMHLQALGQRPRGIERYLQHVVGFLATLPPDAGPEHLTAAAVRSHMRERAATCSSATVVNMLTAVRSFCKFLLEEEHIDLDPTTRVRWPKRTHGLPRALSPAELEALITAIREPAGLNGTRRWYWRRNRRAILLMLYAGVRLAECAALRWADVDLRANLLTVQEGKGGKARILPLHPALRGELARAAGGAVPSRAVVGKYDGTPLNPKALAHIFEEWLPRQGIEGVSAHRLRHTFATEMLKAGADLSAIQEALGHTDISTTRVYLRVDLSRIRAAVDRLPVWF